MINPIEPDQVWRNCHQTWIHCVSAMICCYLLLSHTLARFRFQRYQLEQAFVVTSLAFEVQHRISFCRHLQSCLRVSWLSNTSGTKGLCNYCHPLQMRCKMKAPWSCVWNIRFNYIVFQQVFWTLLGSLQLLRVKSTVEHKKKAESLKDANRLDALRLVVWCFFAYQNCWMDLCWVWGRAFPVMSLLGVLDTSMTHRILTPASAPCFLLLGESCWPAHTDSLPIL